MPDVAEEQPTKKFEIEALRAEAARRREADESACAKWLEGIAKERRAMYEALQVFSSDERNKDFVLHKCRFALEVIDTLKSSDGRRVVPVGVAIHGSCPVVHIQAEGHETIMGKENFNELTHMQLVKGGGIGIFYSDVDTSEYGIPTTDGGLFKFKLDEKEVEKRLAGMR